MEAFFGSPILTNILLIIIIYGASQIATSLRKLTGEAYVSNQHLTMLVKKG